MNVTCNQEEEHSSLANNTWKNARIKTGQKKLEKIKRSLRGHGIPTEHLLLKKKKATFLQGKLIYTKI